MMNIRYGYNKLVARGLFSCAATCRFFILVLLMIVLGVNGVKADDLNEGFYYIANGNKDSSGKNSQYDSSNKNNNYYLTAATGKYYKDNNGTTTTTTTVNETPFLTTYMSFSHNASSGALWEVKKIESGNNTYYQFIHVEDGKYLTANPFILVSNTYRRVSVHLEQMTNTTDINNTLFVVTQVSGQSYYTICHKDVEDSSLNPASNNYDQTDPTNNGGGYGGLIGWGNATGDINSFWYFEEFTLPAPAISVNVPEATFSITAETIPTGCSVRYTTGDGTQTAPTATTGNVYTTSPNTPVDIGDFTNVKVAIVGHQLVLSAVANEPVKCATPVFSSFSQNTNIYDVVVETATSGATLYYTIGTNPADPTTSEGGYDGTGSSPLDIPNVISTIKVIAAKEGLVNSPVLAFVTNPTISLEYDTHAYAGIKLEPSVSINGGSVPSGEYKVTYSNNKNVGTATATVENKPGSNYYVIGSSVDFQITKAPLAVTAKSKTITYGDAPTNAGVTYSGFVGEETESVLSGELAYDYTYTQFGDVGNSYTITPSGLTATNYNITFDPGTLTVEQKEVGLTWSETTSFIYDGTSHCLTATATGMVNSDEIGVTVTGEQTNAGNYTATASELTGAKVGNYKLPAENTHSFTINPVELTVTANDHSITYGNAPSGNGVTYDGFVNGETESVLEGTLAYTYSYSQYGDVGTYTITPKGLTGVNYSISYVNGTLTVNPKALAVTAEAKTKVYGDADPELTYTSVGLINTDAITGDLSRVSGEDVGDYDISQGTLAAPNYTITYTGANLTITPKTLTVTANPKTITYGDAPTNDGVTYSGFAYYENENFLLGTLAYAYNYEQYGNVGEYTITLSGLINDNYSFTYVPGTLTVGQKEVGLDWSETTSFPYDGTAHAPTATATGMVNNDEVVVTVSGDQIAAGNHIATASGLTGTNAGNYKLPADNTQGFTITKAALSVTAADNAITYGQAPSGNGVTYDGFVNGETESVTGVLEGTVDYDYNYTQFGDVGTYTITPKGLTSNNYDISFVAGTLTVEQKEVGLTWDDATPSFTYDGEEHAPTATVTGMVNNDAITVTVLGAQTNAGVNYTATASLTGDKAGNYKLPADNTQSFTITPKSLVTGTTLASHYTLDFGEGNTILLTDNDIRSVLKIGTDYTVGNDTDPSTKYSLRSVEGSGNYTGSFSVRNAVVSFTTDSDQQEWSATFVAESSGATIGHTLPEGVCAFIISGIEGEWAIPEPLDFIPAGVPVLLVAHKQINGFVVTDAESGDVASVDDKKTRNKLKEVTTESDHFNTKEIYVLYKNEFVLNKEGDLAKGKVYMENPNYDSSSPAPAHLKIAWNDMTGIEDGRWKMEDGRSERWYTIDGRRLNGKPTTKGLYINNGNKVVIK